MERVLDSLRSAERTDQGSIVFVTGEAGIGKPTNRGTGYID